MPLTTTKRFNARAAQQAGFWGDNGPALNIEGIVEIAGGSDINIDSTSASYGGTFIGKAAAATGSDFDIAYTSADTMTFSNYPAGVTGLHADDIELVRQINASGAVVETYSRNDTTMSITGNVLTVTGATFGATDTFVVLTNISSGDASAEVTLASDVTDGGNNVYCNTSGDFTAIIVNASKTITIAGLPFTATAANFAAGSVKKIAVTTNAVTGVDMTSVAYAGGILTLANADTNFLTGDIVVVNMIGPDKAYDEALDSQIVTVLNPEYAHYTSVEHLIDESNLGITGTCSDGLAASATVLQDNTSGTAFTNANVAVGFLAYSETTDETATVVSVDSTILATTTAITNWDLDVYWLPECKRFVIPAEGYNYLTIHTRLATTSADNAAYCKIYGTLDANAVDTNDTYWVDLSTDIFGAATLSCTGLTGTQEGIYFVDTTTPILKYMIKVVGEVWDGGGAAIAANSMDVFIKKSS